MRALIAISSCGDFESNGNNQALRDTWLKDAARLGVPYKFFFGVGQGEPEREDAVILRDVPDDYEHLTYKTRASLRWAHEHGFTHVFRCFPDTFVRVDRLMASGFERFDYLGDFRSEVAGPPNYASGGPGYWLSRKAFSFLINAPVLGIWRDDITPWAEDLWTGQILGRHVDAALTYRDEWGKFVNHGSRYWPALDNDTITAHLSCPDPYDKARMYAAHKVWKS
jgi:hypothetical protein